MVLENSSTRKDNKIGKKRQLSKEGNLHQCCLAEEKRSDGH